MGDPGARTRPGTALITGVTGQDGIYLARLLRAEGWRVVGTTRAPSPRAEIYLPDVEVAVVDVRDTAAMADVLDQVRPDEVYNLAALSSVGRSWSEPEVARATNGDAVAGLLTAVRALRDRTARDVRFFQASSAEVSATPGGEARSPYAQGKVVADSLVAEARDRHGLHASIGRLHNHESPLRSQQFVTRKITRSVAAIALGSADHVTLGNLDVIRDWGFAGDHVDAVRRLQRLAEPTDLEVGTGRSHRLSELVEAAFDAAGIRDPWSHVRQDPELLRPADTPALVADPEQAERVLGWRAVTSLRELVGHMVRVDLARLRTGVEDDPAYLDPAVR